MRALQASKRCGNWPTSIFWQLRPSAWRCDVDHRAVLRHRDTDASVLIRVTCRSVVDHRSWRQVCEAAVLPG